MAAKVAILGAGAWGTAVAKAIADKGIEVVLWAHEAQVADDINLRHTNSRYLPGAALPTTISATSDVVEAATDRAQDSLVEALGTGIDDLIADAEKISGAVVAAASFPADPRKRAAG